MAVINETGRNFRITVDGSTVITEGVLSVSITQEQIEGASPLARFGTLEFHDQTPTLGIEFDDRATNLWNFGNTVFVEIANDFDVLVPVGSYRITESFYDLKTRILTVDIADVLGFPSASEKAERNASGTTQANRKTRAGAIATILQKASDEPLTVNLNFSGEIINFPIGKEDSESYVELAQRLAWGAGGYVLYTDGNGVIRSFQYPIQTESTTPSSRFAENDVSDYARQVNPANRINVVEASGVQISGQSLSDEGEVVSVVEEYDRVFAVFGVQNIAPGLDQIMLRRRVTTTDIPNGRRVVTQAPAGTLYQIQGLLPGSVSPLAPTSATLRAIITAEDITETKNYGTDGNLISERSTALRAKGSMVQSFGLAPAGVVALAGICASLQVYRDTVTTYTYTDLRIGTVNSVTEGAAFQKLSIQFNGETFNSFSNEVVNIGSRDVTYEQRGDNYKRTTQENDAITGAFRNVTEFIDSIPANDTAPESLFIDTRQRECRYRPGNRSDARRTELVTFDYLLDRPALCRLAQIHYEQLEGRAKAFLVTRPLDDSFLNANMRPLLREDITEDESGNTYSYLRDGQGIYLISDGAGGRAAAYMSYIGIWFGSSGSAVPELPPDLPVAFPGNNNFFLDPIADRAGFEGIAIVPIQVTYNNQTGPVTIIVSGLPAGLFYNAATEQIVGSPTTTFSGIITVDATDDNTLDTDQVTFQLDITAVGPSNPTYTPIFSVDDNRARWGGGLIFADQPLVAGTIDIGPNRGQWSGDITFEDVAGGCNGTNIGNDADMDNDFDMGNNEDCDPCSVGNIDNDTNMDNDQAIGNSPAGCGCNALNNDTDIDNDFNVENNDGC